MLICRYSTKPLLRDLPATRFSSFAALHHQQLLNGAVRSANLLQVTVLFHACPRVALCIAKAGLTLDLVYRFWLRELHELHS